MFSVFQSMSWLLRLSSEGLDSDYISSLSRQNPRPFAKWFTQGDREYIPFGQIQGADKEIEEFVKDEGCQITDYRAGLGQCGKRVFRIGKLLEQARKRDLAELQQKQQRGELYDIERDIKQTNEYYDGLSNTFINSQFRVSRKSDEMMVVISQNPHDIAYMSTGRDWTSCMEIGKGSHHQDVYCEVKEGGLIAYLIRANDKNIEHPLARVLIKRFTNKEGNSIAIPEQTVYGNPVEGFDRVVKQWVDSKQGSIAPGYYKRQGGEWSDTFPRNMLVAPSLNTPEDKQDILKWLRKEVPLVHTEWIVTDNLVQYSEDPEDDTQSFKTKEEADNYVLDRAMSDYEEEEIRESLGEEWTEQDDEGNWVASRYTVRKKEKDFSGEMQTQSIETILNAEKGTFPIEVIQEIKEILSHGHWFAPMLKQLLKKYPELFTEEEYKEMGETQYLEYVMDLPDDSVKKQQVRQQYLQETSNYLKNPYAFYDDKLNAAIHSYSTLGPHPKPGPGPRQRGSDPQLEDGIQLYFSISFSDNAIDPLMSLFTKDHQGTQKATPIPENSVRELVDFCTDLPRFKILDGPLLLNKKYLTSIFSRVVHLFHQSGTDTPTVQRFYQWLAESSYYNDGLNRDYSSINVETLGSAIAGLGENGRQFIPWAQQKLQESQQEFQNLKENPSTNQNGFEYKRSKLKVERFLYIIDALEKGKPSGKYRFYSRKNWLQKLGSKYYEEMNDQEKDGVLQDFISRYGIEQTPDGKIVLYHGTRSSKTIRQLGYFAKGTYFTTDPSYAAHAGDQNVGRGKVQVFKHPAHKGRGLLNLLTMSPRNMRRLDTPHSHNL